MKKYNLLVVVCHPDDESVWLGAFLSEIHRFSFINPFILCLSGNDSDSPRDREFKAALEIAKIKGTVTGFKLRAALDPLPDIATTVVETIRKEMNWTATDIDLLITHSPFGDEQRHPHHMQAYKSLLKFSKDKAVPFGFFSCLPMLHLNLIPLLDSCHRLGTLHLLNISGCRRQWIAWFATLVKPRLWWSLQNPKYYLQFQSSFVNKEKMLECYRSVNPQSFSENYAMYTTASESFYIFCDRGMRMFWEMQKAMPIAGVKDLFQNLNFLKLIRKKITSLINAK